MELITGVFHSRSNAEEAVRQLQELGIPKNRVGLLAPEADPELLERSIPVSDSEAPGMGEAMGSVVGGAMGAAGGATLGLATASLLVPGVGPVIAFGVLGAALLGVSGAVAGGVIGETVEEELGEGLPHEDAYVYEEALANGHSVVIAYVQPGQAGRARDIMAHLSRESINELREQWWNELKNREEMHYGSDFKRDEISYRRGFEAAQHLSRRGRPYREVESELRSSYDDGELDSAFRRGYERGVSYRIDRVESRRG